MRLIVVSNRLPVVLDRRDDGTWESHPGSAAWCPRCSVLRTGMAFGSAARVGLRRLSGAPRALAAATRKAGYALVPVDIPAEDHDGFYRGFANESIWPLFHDLPSLCRFDPSYFPAAVRVNARFAATVAQHATRTTISSGARLPPDGRSPGDA